MGKRTTTGRIVGPLRAGAAHIIERLKEFGRKRNKHKTHAGEAGTLDHLAQAVGELIQENAFLDTGADFSCLQEKLDALVSILLNVKDDRLAGEAASPLAAEMTSTLERVEELFLNHKSFFSELETSNPNLEVVQNALLSKDYNHAKKELHAQFLAYAPSPALNSWLTRLEQKTLMERELVTRGFFRIHRPEAKRKSWVYLGTKLNWSMLPYSEPHEHGETAILARAYAATGDEKLARTAIDRMMLWATCSCPPPKVAKQTDGCHLSEHSKGMWSSSTTALRCSNFATSIFLLRDSKYFTPSVGRILFALANETAKVLVNQKVIGARAGAGLILMSEMFSFFAAAPSWCELATEIIDDVISHDVLSDGSLTTNSLLEHEYLMGELICAALVKEENIKLKRTVQRMLTYESALLMPDGSFGDEKMPDPGKTSSRRENLQVANSLLTPDAPFRPIGFHEFNEGGYYCMRGGSPDAPEMLLVTSNPPYRLRVGEGDSRVLSTNILPRGGVRLEEVSVRVNTHSGPPCDYIRLAAGARDITLRREIIYVNRRYWVIADRCRSVDEQDWKSSFDLYKKPQHESDDGRSFVQNGMLVSLLGPTDIGFAFEATKSHLHAVMSRSGTDVRFITVLYPLRDTPLESVSVEPITVDGTRAIGALVRHLGGEELSVFPHGSDRDALMLKPYLKDTALAEDAAVAVLGRSNTETISDWRVVFDSV